MVKRLQKQIKTNTFGLSELMMRTLPLKRPTKTLFQHAKPMERQYNPCTHVYRGKTFVARSGFPLLKFIYEVIGASSATGKTTIPVFLNPN